MTLNFLVRLQQVRLPLCIENPEEIKHVSVLKATGLIEAEIHPRFQPGAPYVQPRTATVTCITDEGMAQLHQWLGETWKQRA